MTNLEIRIGRVAFGQVNIEEKHLGNMLKFNCPSNSIYDARFAAASLYILDAFEGEPSIGDELNFNAVVLDLCLAYLIAFKDQGWIADLVASRKILKVTTSDLSIWAKIIIGHIDHVYIPLQLMMTKAEFLMGCGRIASVYKC